MINKIKHHKPYLSILKYSLSTFFVLSTIIFHQYQKIANLIKQRLSYMKHIAKYKFEKHLSVEDYIQENKVILNFIQKAETLGLNKKSIEPFLISQISVAKAIQYRYKTEWLSMPKIISQYDDLEEIRLNISKLNDCILQLISKELKKNGQIKKQIYFHINEIQLHNFNNTDKERICLSLKKVYLKK